MSELLRLYRTVAFCGSRGLIGPDFRHCRETAQYAANLGLIVLTGDANGADAAARMGAPSARVFYVKQGDIPYPAALAIRSVSMIRALAQREPAALLIAYPDAICPDQLRPSSNPRQCFSGKGSGTWASVCFALGLGLPVLVYRKKGHRLEIPAWGIGEEIGKGVLHDFTRLFVRQYQMILEPAY